MADARERRTIWTVDTYAAHNEAIRMADAKFDAERDRRYTEVKNAEEKALSIKEKADEMALKLAREIQTYKDEKANELREQINSERGHYATKDDLMAAVEKIEAKIGPVLVFVATAQGQRTGVTDSRQLLTWFLGIALTLITIYVFTQRAQPMQPAPQVIMVPAPPNTLIPQQTGSPGPQR